MAGFWVNPSVNRLCGGREKKPPLPVNRHHPARKRVSLGPSALVSLADESLTCPTWIAGLQACQMTNWQGALLGSFSRFGTSRNRHVEVALDLGKTSADGPSGKSRRHPCVWRPSPAPIIRHKKKAVGVFLGLSACWCETTTRSEKWGCCRQSGPETDRGPGRAKSLPAPCRPRREGAAAMASSAFDGHPKKTPPLEIVEKNRGALEKDPRAVCRPCCSNLLSVSGVF